MQGTSRAWVQEPYEPNASVAAGPRRAGEVVPASLADNLTRLIAEGTGEEDEGADQELRAGAVEAYLELLDKPKLPPVLLKVGTALGRSRREEGESVEGAWRVPPRRTPAACRPPSPLSDHAGQAVSGEPRVCLA